VTPDERAPFHLWSFRFLRHDGALGSCPVTRDGKAATCGFSVDLIKGALDDGRPC
jgi:hypothetical protein